MPPATSSLLGLGLKFIPKLKKTTAFRELQPMMERLERDMHRKIYFSGGDSEMEERKSKLYVPSDWRPELEDVPHFIDSRLARFKKALGREFKSRSVPSNLLKFQETILNNLRDNHGIVIANTDKGLGPCAIELPRYSRDILDQHLTDASTYELLSEEDALAAAEQLKSEIKQWLEKYGEAIGDRAREYIEYELLTNEDPFGYFYGLYKIHKLASLDGVESVPTRPVCSSCGAIDHPLGAWVNEQLQPVAQAQPSFFKNSFECLQQLRELEVPANAFFFTADATSLYTNIPTEPALEIVSEYLRENAKDYSYNVDALVAALEIVFRNNLFRFGDLYSKQTRGTAMGKRPAPPWATIFFGIHENDFVPRWWHCLQYYKRYIDDILGIWLAHPDPETDARLWAEFQSIVGSFHGLEWSFTKRSRSGVVFMDMSLSIENGRVESTLYEKKLALYLYIPPASAHPPGVTAGLVMGNVLRILQLCTREADLQQHLDAFFYRMLDRGHQQQTLLPLFNKAIQNAQRYLSKSEDERLAAKKQRSAAAARQVYLHLPYHPDNPSPGTIQRLWREHVSYPPGDTPLTEMKNKEGHSIEVDRMVIAFHRAPNMGNLLSYRKIAQRSGPKVSSYVG